MSRTLNLIDILLTTGRHLFLVGRFTEALVPLTKLVPIRVTVLIIVPRVPDGGSIETRVGRSAM